MKKNIYLFFAALLAVACVEPLQPYLGPVINEPEEGAPVTIEFSLPPMTKATWAHNPSITTIHVAVFNQAGVLKQFEQATLTNRDNVMNGNNPDGNPTYSVTVNMSSNPRILHFIADSPIATFDELVAAAGTSGEDVILNALTTSGGDVAYWQRFELQKIDAYTYNGVSYTVPGTNPPHTYTGTSYTYDSPQGQITVNQGDFIKRDGTKVLDGTGYFMSDYVKGIVANIPFIRNFAEVTVSRDEENGSNFIPVKYALMNVPKAGYVAPFDTKKDAFASAFIGVDNLKHETIANTGYPGSLAGSIDPSVPTSFINLTGDNDLAKKAYLYERPIPNPQQPATCILVAGVYDDPNAVTDEDGLTWFKFEITNNKITNGNAYFPIYRGISYDIKIGYISGASGYDSPEAAAAADAIGDISGSPTTATLDQISDGKGTTLWVEYVDYVATQPETKTFYYTMYYQANGTTTYLNNTVNLTVNNPEESYPAITASVVVDPGTFTTGTPDPTKTWKKATVTLGTDGQTVSNTLHSILHVEGTSHENKPMYRDVHYRVMSTQEFQNGDNKVKAKALKTEAAGEETTLTIYLPSDLGYSMFPLTLRIEAQNGNFTTVDGLPVESGPSLFDASKNTFYFLKTIEYTDYYNASTGVYTTAFTTKFKTTRAGNTTAAGTNATYFRVLDKVKTGRTTPYFNYAQCYVAVGGPVFELSANSVSVKANVMSATFSITSTGDDDPTWTLTPSSNISSLSANPAFTENYKGSGNATITVNFPENISETDPVTYTVTAKRTGFDDQVFTITQEKVSTAYYTINLNPLNTYDWGTSDQNPSSNTYYGYMSKGNYNVNSADGGWWSSEVISIATMSITIVGYTEFKIYIDSYAESNYDYVVVRNNAWTNAWSPGSVYNNNGTKAHTRGNQKDPSVEGNYTEVTFTIADGLTNDDTPHTFYIQYGKDTSTHDNYDRGYVLIPTEYTFVSQ